MRDLEIRIRVAAIIIENNRILLIAHKKNDVISWLLPGGGLNPGESLVEALKRELKEELDISVDVHDVALICDSIPANTENVKKHIVNICFFCAHNSGEYKLDREKILFDYNFFDVAELESLRIFPPIKSELKKILSGYKDMVYLGKKWINI